MKLRQRRGADDTNSTTILPLTNAPLSNAAPLKRRRRKRRDSDVHPCSSQLCYYCSCCVICLALLLSVRSLGGITGLVTITVTNPMTRVFHPQRRSVEKTDYAPISCPDGTLGFKDDDYCDCEDGSDEVNTAACSHILVQKAEFQCHDGSLSIYNSRVHDGVNDCSDKSDETR